MASKTEERVNQEIAAKPSWKAMSINSNLVNTILASYQTVGLVIVHSRIDDPLSILAKRDEEVFALHVWSLPTSDNMSSLLFVLHARVVKSDGGDVHASVKLFIIKIIIPVGIWSYEFVIDLIENDANFDQVVIKSSTCGRRIRQLLQTKSGWEFDSHENFTYHYAEPPCTILRTSPETIVDAVRILY